MQKIVIATLSVLLVACHAEEKKPPESKTAAAESGTSLPYTATYSSRFELGDQKNAEAVLNLWKDWDNGDLMASRKLFADTIELQLRDGTQMSGPTDSILKGVQQFRNSLSAVKSSVIAYVPLKSTDKNENWVSIWGLEVSTDKTGKVDSVDLQETWRFNKDGKADVLYQFGKAVSPAPMTK